jgi:hypothetical protein
MSLLFKKTKLFLHDVAPQLKIPKLSAKAMMAQTSIAFSKAHNIRTPQKQGI